MKRFQATVRFIYINRRTIGVLTGALLTLFGLHEEVTVVNKVMEVL